MKSLRIIKLCLSLTVIIMLSVFMLACNAASGKQNCPYGNFKPVKMIFLPDTHISFRADNPQKEENDWILYNESFVIFQDVIKSIKTMPDLDFMVFGGDLVNNDDNSLGDLSLFIDSIDDVRFKYFTILGDREADLKEGGNRHHLQAPDFSNLYPNDSRSITKQDFCAEFRSNGFNNPDLTYWAEKYGDKVLLIGLDTSIENKFEGKLPAEELVWLDDTLKDNPDRFTIIFMHHPAVETALSDKTVWKKFVLENPDEFLKVINKYPQVKLVMSGHHHNYAVKKLNGKLFMSFPSIATYPNQYKILKIFPDRVEVENKNITFKQIIKKAKNNIVKTDYAKEYDVKQPKNILKFQENDKISKTKAFYY